MSKPQHTKDKLADALKSAAKEAGIHEAQAGLLVLMASKAEEGYYHDYLSPLDFPEMELDRDLRAVGTKEAMLLRARHHNGEFDANLEESDAWAESQDGQAAYRALFESAVKRGNK